jgi:preprotein translocase subunit SecG
MSVILLIAIILICIVLSFFVLIQNPKGGGLSGSFGGYGNQVMGAKQSAEGVEKVTWWSMAALAGIVLLSFVLMDKPTNSAATGNEAGKPLKATTAPIQAPPVNTAPVGNSAPAGTAPASGAAGAPASTTEAPLPKASSDAASSTPANPE